MKNTQNKILQRAALFLLQIFWFSQAAAEETIIQQEKISFEKCLEIITVSENKLSIAPKIKDVLDQKRVAVFTLVDGTLTITCDGEEGNVKVSTKSN